jgi:pentatricopeptide repeat protein
MVKNGMKPIEDAMYAVLGACSEEGNWNLALNVFQNMLKQPNLIACNALINLLGKAGEIKLAFKVLKILESWGHTPDEYIAWWPVQSKSTC